MLGISSYAMLTVQYHDRPSYSATIFKVDSVPLWAEATLNCGVKPNFRQWSAIFLQWLSSLPDPIKITAY